MCLFFEPDRIWWAWSGCFCRRLLTREHLRLSIASCVRIGELCPLGNGTGLLEAKTSLLIECSTLLESGQAHSHPRSDSAISLCHGGASFTIHTAPGFRGHQWAMECLLCLFDACFPLRCASSWTCRMLSRKRPFDLIGWRGCRLKNLHLSRVLDRLCRRSS